MCFELRHINIPKSVKTIGHHAFMNCDKLERITLSENIKRIGTFAFSGCDNLIIECKRDAVLDALEAFGDNK